jgi:hypothetical protein
MSKRKQHITIDWKLLYTRLNEQRALNGMSWRGVARAVDLAASSSFTRLKAGKSLSAEAFARCLYWLDREALDFLKIPASRAWDDA